MTESERIVAGIKSKLIELRQSGSLYQSFGPSSGPLERAPLKPAYCGPLLSSPSWFARSQAAIMSKNPAWLGHNLAVLELWKQIECPGCGGCVTSGIGRVPNGPIDPGKPPRFCYGCDLHGVRPQPQPCFVPFVDEEQYLESEGWDWPG